MNRTLERTANRRRIGSAATLLAASLALWGCGDVVPGGPDAPPTLDSPIVTAALEAIRAEAVEEHLRVLAHDSLLGRAPGTPGFDGAMRYVEDRLVELGLAPAGTGGTFHQELRLLEGKVRPQDSGMTIVSDAGAHRLQYGVDFYLGADPGRDASEVSAPVVFVGYGVSAPGLGYDDYAELDVQGRIVAYLSGGPPAFPSNQRAYYSSGRTKRAEAERRGAVGILTFTSPDDPRFRWEVDVARSQRGSFAWMEPGAQDATEADDAEPASSVLGSASLNHAAARALFEGAPRSLEDVFEAASASIPQAFELPVTVTLSTSTDRRNVDSYNLVARLEGGDPSLRDEHVVYVAHVDHFGVGALMDGDSIYNGAHDNASGVSIVLEIARAFASLPEPPRRSILFLFVTAEEWGLHGSDYFAQYPTVPADGLVATFSLDMPFLFHPLLDIVPYGADHSSLSEAVEASAAHLGLAIGPDPIPEQVLFIRSDHYSFIRRGVPALFIKSGFETGDAALDGSAINSAYRADVYHTPRDEADQSFDFDAGAAHARVNFLTGYYVSMKTERPAWNPGDFFGELFGSGR